MSEELPQPRTAEEIRAEELRPYWLDPREDYPEPHFLFEYNGVGFSPLGGIQAISGQKKNGKTFVLAQLMAAALGTGTERVTTYLGSLKTRESTIEWLGHKPKVLYCDTEMEKLNTAKVLRRVHWLCGWDMKQPSDQFFVLWLREVPKTDFKTSNSERWRLIKNAIEQVSPDVVFVDGLRDLVNDFNDNQESAAIVGEMMSLASQRNICIWNVLHMNPRPQNDDESKMRGHLGTELGNKVSDTFISTKKKDQSTGQVTFTVKQQDARGKDVDDWQFEVTDDVGGLGIPRILTGITLLTAEEQKRRQDTLDADDYFKRYNWTSTGATYTDLEKWLRMKGVTSNRRIKTLFDTALETGIIYKNEKKKYHYKGLNKQLLNDSAEVIPFEKMNPNDETPF
jgi:hypothetical protein